MNKIIFFSPYFGSLPPLAKIIFQSWGRNKNLDFLIHTDNESDCLKYGAGNYPNIRLVKIEYPDFLKLLGNNLSLNTELLKTQKAWCMCKLRPAFGECFNSLIKQYLFWGYIDIDVLLGKTKNFLTDDLLDEYDIFPFTHIIRGNIILFKNTHKINVLWRSVPHYCELLEAPSNNARFDEAISLHFSKAVKEREDLKVYQHTKNTNWTVDFRWSWYPGLRLLFWRKSISEVVYYNYRLYDKFYDQEFAGVVLDELSKWTHYHGFLANYREDFRHVCFFNPEILRIIPLKAIKDPNVFYEICYQKQKRTNIKTGLKVYFVILIVILEKIKFLWILIKRIICFLR